MTPEEVMTYIDDISRVLNKYEGALMSEDAYELRLTHTKMANILF